MGGGEKPFLSYSSGSDAQGCMFLWFSYILSEEHLLLASEKGPEMCRE